MNDNKNKPFNTIHETFEAANLKKEGRYTIFTISDFGFPAAMQITLKEITNTRYAQYDDAVRLVFVLKGKRKLFQKYFYSTSFIICEGWVNVDNSKSTELVSKDSTCTVTRSKYCSFDSRYIDDAEQYLDNIIAIYKNYQRGVNGQLYA